MHVALIRSPQLRERRQQTLQRDVSPLHIGSVAGQRPADAVRVRGPVRGAVRYHDDEARRDDQDAAVRREGRREAALLEEGLEAAVLGHAEQVVSLSTHVAPRHAGSHGADDACRAVDHEEGLHAREMRHAHGVEFVAGSEELRTEDIV